MKAGGDGGAVRLIVERISGDLHDLAFLDETQPRRLIPAAEARPDPENC
jgi:hypothetical protein